MDSAHWMSQSGCFVIMRSIVSIPARRLSVTLRFSRFSCISPGKWCVWNQAITTSCHSILNFSECLYVHLHLCIAASNSLKSIKNRTEQTLTKLWPMHNLQENANDYCKTQNVQGTVPFYPMLPDFQKSTAFWNVPRFCPFVLLVRATWRWRWVWSVAEVLGEKPVTVPLFPSQVLHGYTWDQTPAFTVKSRQLTDWFID